MALEIFNYECRSPVRKIVQVVHLKVRRANDLPGHNYFAAHAIPDRAELHSKKRNCAPVRNMNRMPEQTPPKESRNVIKLGGNPHRVEWPTNRHKQRFSIQQRVEKVWVSLAKWQAERSITQLSQMLANLG